MRGSIEQVLAGEAQWAVVQGDCKEVLATMPDKSGVVVTDVPYNVGKKIEGDQLPWEEYLPWLDARLLECQRVGRLVFTFYAATKLIRFIRETTVPPNFEVNWHKPMMLHGRSLNGSPFLAHREAILYWGPMSPKEAGKLGYDSVAFDAMWPRERRAAGIEHPTPKPIKGLVRCLGRWTRPGEVVIDPFCGSGNHLVAALRTGRRAIGIDIDPQWVAESVAQLEHEDKHTTLGDAQRGQQGFWSDGTDQTKERAT